MADGVEYTQEDYEIAYDGLIQQAQAEGCYGAICLNNNLPHFLHNTAEVIAYERAYNRMLQNALHEMSFRENK